MKLNNDYWHNMDRVAECCTSDVNVDSLASNIGVSHGVGDLVQGMKSKVFAGASHVELGFTGKGKGYLAGGQTTPEMFGNKQRQDIRQMGKINDVSISTHATVAFTGLSGQTERGFSDEVREQNLHEIKRAIEFAADTAEGGAVVFHVGEFPRPLSQYPQFEFHPKEKEKEIHYLVDNRSGQIFKTVSEDEEVWTPKLKMENSKPVYITKEVGGKQINIPVYETDPETKEIQVQKIRFKDFMPEEEDRAKAAVEFYKQTVISEIEHASGQADEYEIVYKDALEQRKKIEERLKHYEYLKQVTPPDKWEAFKETISSRDPFLPPETVDPIGHLKNALRDTDKRMSYGREVAISSRKNAAKLSEGLNQIEDIKSYATQKSADAIARAAIYAYDTTKLKRLQNPVFVSPENLFPEWGYGNHPEEMKEIILDAREAMKKRLMQERRMPEGEAKRIASDHIKATFDIAHANLWQKFWKGDPNKSIVQNQEEFHKWLLDQADKLNKEGIIGHVHLSDNFGYGDEHLSVGEGNVPVKDFLSRMRKGGFKGKSIAEIGAQPQGRENEALTEAWQHVHDLFSPIYRTDTLTRTWGDVHKSYFAHTQSPRFLVGETTPDPQEWVLYSGVPLE